MVIGESAKFEDVECNPCKTKQLTNVRSVMKEEAIRLATPKVFTLEEAMAYMEGMFYLWHACTPHVHMTNGQVTTSLLITEILQRF